jgi:transposase-like protein
MATRRLFSREFKLESVRLVVERGVSVAQVAATKSTRTKTPKGADQTVDISTTEQSISSSI